MTFQTTLANIELLPEGSGVSKMSGTELLERLALVFDYLPEGTTFQVNGENVSITVPESLATQKAEAERLAEKAAQRARQGEYEKAKDIYRRVLELDPVHPNARRDLAMICVETGDNDEAKDYLIESLRLAPEDAWSLVVLANQYAKEDRWQWPPRRSSLETKSMSRRMKHSGRSSILPAHAASESQDAHPISNIRNKDGELPAFPRNGP